MAKLPPPEAMHGYCDQQFSDPLRYEYDAPDAWEDKANDIEKETADKIAAWLRREGFAPLADEIAKGVWK